MSEIFHRDESGYVNWLTQHKNGFVFNNFGSPNRDINLLHRASCMELHRPGNKGARTNYEKVCSDDLENLISIANQIRGSEGWRECRRCRPLNEEEVSLGPERRRSSEIAPSLSTAASGTTESAPEQLLMPRDFGLWRPVSTEATPDIEPLLASWDAKSTPSQQRVQAYLDELERALAGHLDAMEAQLYLDVEVVRPVGSDLLRHYDLENYLTPIVQRLHNSNIVLAKAIKRHPKIPSDRSRITVGLVDQRDGLEGWSFHGTSVPGSPDTRFWKSALRQSLIATGCQPAAKGPLEMVIAWRRDPRRRAWWNLWKPTGDALGPVLGEPLTSNPFDPADDRVVSLEMHYCPPSNLGNVTQVGIWWREAT